MNKRQEEILDEQFFPYHGMSLRKRNYYLSIIKNLKDVCDTENKVDNESTCKVIEMYLKKEKNVVEFNGSLSIGRENRCIEGYLFINNMNNILADYKVTRLCVDDSRKKYTVLDEFKIEDDVIKRKSQYNYDMLDIDDEIERGKIKWK